MTVALIDGLKKIKTLQSLARISMSMTQQSLELSVVPGLDLIGYEHGQELRKAEVIALGFHESNLNRIGHAR